MFKLGRPSNTGNLPPIVSNPVLFVAFFLDVTVSMFNVFMLWELFQVVSLLMAIIYFCLSMTLFEMKVHSSIHILSDESIRVLSSSFDPLLPNSLDASHLANFCSHVNPLACLTVIDSLSDKSDYSHYASAAQDAVNRINVFLSKRNISFEVSKCQHEHECSHYEPPKSFKQMHLVWDTGASQGLTPFLNDFIHYHKCDIPVKDISKVNRVIRIGTVMYKFCAMNGEDIFLPGVAFHLPSAEVHLLSPQSYHQHWGGYSMVGQKSVLMNLWHPDGKPSHVLEFPLHDQSNVHTVVNVSCTAKERETFGPLLYPAIAKHVLAFDDDWRCLAYEVEHDFLSASIYPTLTDSSNVNLTEGQKELLLWHWKLGISMSRIQKLVVPHCAKDANSLQDMMPCVITPTFKTAATCLIPRCAACELSRAQHCPTGSTKQLAVEEKEGILAANQYQVGDLVSMDQLVSSTPGRLFHGYGREVSTNAFRGVPSLMRQLLELFRLSIKSPLALLRLSVPRNNLRSGCMSCVMQW